MIWYDMTWHDMIWYDMIWYDVLCYELYITWSITRSPEDDLSWRHWPRFAALATVRMCESVHQPRSSNFPFRPDIAFRVSSSRRFFMCGFYYHFNNLILNNPQQLVITCLTHVVICPLQVNIWKMGCWNDSQTALWMFRLRLLERSFWWPPVWHWSYTLVLRSPSEQFASIDFLANSQSTQTNYT